MSDNFFDESREIKPNWVKFNKVGDYFRGTLTGFKDVKSNFPGKEGKIVRQYQVLTSEGSFHLVDDLGAVIEEPRTIGKGEFWNFSKDEKFDDLMRQIKVGQKFGVRLKLIVPAKTKGFHPAKVLSVVPDEMDSEYMGETVSDMPA